MSLRFAARMARRDGRGGVRTLAVCGAAIALGVASLVALESFRLSVRDAVAARGRGLLGADLALSSRRPFPDDVRALLDSLATSGQRVAHATDFPSMVLAAGGGRAQLLEVRGLEGGWPFYGQVTTEPPGAWELLAGSGGAAGGLPAAALDPEAALQLEAGEGDTLELGEARFRVVAVATDLPGRSPAGVFDRPRVYVPARALPATGLLQRGSLVTHRAYVAFASGGSADAFLDARGEKLRADGIRSTTPAREQRRLAGEAGTGTRFLALVGLAALLLGGLGAASGARVLAASRMRSAALLRCLGADRRSVLGIYVLEALAVALAASTVGAGAGIALQAWLPHLLDALLPVPVAFGLHPGVVAAGIGVGTAAGGLFTLIPLLDVRTVPPLAALRRAEVGGGEEPAGRDPWRWVAGLLAAAGVTGVCVWQAPAPRTGLVYAGGLAFLAALLAGAGAGLSRAARRLLPRGAPFPIRQGLSNLFRPRAQTTAVVVALGLATFLVGTLVAVRANLVRKLGALTAPGQPDLVLFDIQPDQRDGVRRLLEDGGRAVLEPTPIVVLRIAALDGVDASALRARARGRDESGGPDQERGGSSDAPRPEAWALGREYRSTWRDTLARTETLVAGRWWDSAWGGGPRPAGVSLSTDIADDLGVGIGDSITWEVAGRTLPTVVTSLRRVDWARPALNFFAVFQPGSLGDEPATWVVLTRIPDPGARAAFQRRLVERFPNVSAVDLTRVAAAVRQVAGTVAGAVRLMTAFVVAAGLLVLLAAVWTSRRQRLRETVLLRTLGAGRGTIRAILLTEYACLGGLAGIAGALLAGLAAWAVVARGFGLDYRAPWAELALVGAAAALAAVLVGAAAGGRVLAAPPLETLRKLDE